MPIREILALAAVIFGGIFVTHPLSFRTTIRQVQFSILREITRTDNWGDPSLYHTNRYTAPHGKIYSSPHHKASRKP
jgi:hypothetical protein